MTTIQTTPIKPQEAYHLFGVLERHGVPCSLEMNALQVADPILGIVQAPVKTDYFEGGPEDNAVLVDLGESCFSFGISSHAFSKITRSHQIEICIASDRYVCWFKSGELSPEAFKEACEYIDQEPIMQDELDKHETALIRYLRSLSFDDLLDANNAILGEADQAQLQAIHKQAAGERSNANGFRERVETLRELAELLANANADYRKHISPEGGEPVHADI